MIKSKPWVIKTALLSVLLFSALPVYSVVYNWGETGRSFDLHSTRYTELSRDNSGREQVTMQRSGPRVPDSDSIYLSFDSKSRTDRNMAGRVEKSSVRFKTFSDSIGRAVSFEQPRHEYLLSTPDYMFLNQSRHSGDFSIYFMIRPYQLRRQMPIMRKYGLFGGRRRGFSVNLESSLLVFRFHNLFWGNKRPLEELVIKSSDLLQHDVFQRVLLTYDESSGRMSLYVNGVEQNTVYVTDNFRPGGTRLLMKFHKYDRSPVVFGRGFLGALDEIIFSNSVIPHDEGGQGYGAVRQNGVRFSQKAAVAESRVVALQYSGGNLLSARYKAETPAASSLKMYIRGSDRKFAPGTSEAALPYVRFEKADDLKGRFFQWKAVLRASPDGSTSPALKNVKLSFKENPPPSKPRALQVVSASVTEGVKLRFLRNAEMDVINGGRYLVYYGVKPYEPQGVIRYVDFSAGGNKTINDADHRLETDDLRYQNRIQVTITNDMIAENLHYAENKPRLRFAYPLLQYDIPYYFWVTACDSTYTESPVHEDHESEPSETVIARPD